MAPEERVEAGDDPAADPGPCEGNVHGKEDASGDESAHAEHGGMAEAHLAEVAAKPVPGERRADVEEGQGDEVLRVARGMEDGGPRRRESDHHHEPDERLARDPGENGSPRHPRLHHRPLSPAEGHPSTRWPNKPPGRSTRTSTRSTKPTAAVR